MSATTATGWETMIMCDPSASVMVALARSAMDRVTSAPATLSPVATTDQPGKGLPDGRTGGL